MTKKQDELDKILDWQGKAVFEAMLKVVGYGKNPKVVVTEKLLNKHRNEAKSQILSKYIEKSELPEHKPYKCEKGHVQVKKCQFGHEIYAHSARWCCACDADISFATAWVKDEPEFKDKYIEKSRVVEAIGNDEAVPNHNSFDMTEQHIRNQYREQLKTELGLEE